MAMEGDWPAIAQIYCFPVGQGITASLGVIDSTGIVISKPHRLCAIRTDGGAGQNQNKLCLSECTICAFTPCSLDSGMMMLIANHQHFGMLADRLQFRQQTLHGRPGGTYIYA